MTQMSFNRDTAVTQSTCTEMLSCSGEMQTGAVVDFRGLLLLWQITGCQLKAD
jgi:hypothetical protein